jgi:hypothetical protein
MSHTIKTNEDVPIIDHPSQDGWMWNTIIAPLPEVKQAMLKDRFSRTDVNIPQLFDAIGTANMMAAAYRQERELVNKQHLMTGTDGNLVNEQYAALAGHLDKVGEYVRWFGNTALSALRLRSPKDRFNSISMELGGAQQNGDWDCTTKLDQMAVMLPSLVAKAGSDANLVFASKAARKVSYLLMPIFVDESREFSHAILRRRRAVADINTADGDRMEVFKQSLGLVVLERLDPKDRKRILDEAVAHDPIWCVQPNNSIANIAGNVFEEAIHQKDRSHVTSIVPVSAQYLLRLRAVESSETSIYTAA